MLQLSQYGLCSPLPVHAGDPLQQHLAGALWLQIDCIVVFLMFLSYFLKSSALRGQAESPPVPRVTKSMSKDDWFLDAQSLANLDQPVRPISF